MIKRIKILYNLYNILHRKELLYNEVNYKKYGLNKKYYSSISSSDFENIKDENSWLDENNSEIELPKNKLFNTLDLKFKDSLINWSKNGYAVLPSFFAKDKIDIANSTIQQLIDSGKAKWQNGNKIMFALHQDDFLKEMGNSKIIKEILEMLMGKEIDIFQSINFIEGSKQRTHSDSVHMTTFPTGNITAIWIALEDMTLENGPLHYYPGSHKLPYILNKDYGNEGNKWLIGNKTYDKYEDKIQEVIGSNNLKKEINLAKKGDVFIWHANLLHGGEAILDKKSTRKSMVFHYYAKEAICYHEIKQRPTLKR